MFEKIVMTIILTLAFASLFVLLTLMNSVYIEEWGNKKPYNIVIYFLLLALLFAIWVVWY